ncbi:MAG: vitamin K epoxide reductase family protein [Microbacteriaceae bacterium]
MAGFLVTVSSRALAPVVIVTGVLGLVAAIALLLETIALISNPAARLTCDINPLVGCGRSISSAQGSLLGVPNPVLGLVFWSATLAIGLALAAGSRPARWFQLGFLTAVTGAFALVMWFIVQSVFVIGVLCPWCMLTWAVTIPLFWMVLLDSVVTGVLPLPVVARRVATVLRGWLPTLTLVSYLLVAVAVQLRLNLLALFVR